LSFAGAKLRKKKSFSVAVFRPRIPQIPLNIVKYGFLTPKTALFYNVWRLSAKRSNVKISVHFWSFFGQFLQNVLL